MYTHLSKQQRIELAILLREGYSLRGGCRNSQGSPQQPEPRAGAQPEPEGLRRLPRG